MGMPEAYDAALVENVSIRHYGTEKFGMCQVDKTISKTFVLAIGFFLTFSAQIRAALAL